MSEVKDQLKYQEGPTAVGYGDGQIYTTWLSILMRFTKLPAFKPFRFFHILPVPSSANFAVTYLLILCTTLLTCGGGSFLMMYQDWLLILIIWPSWDPLYRILLLSALHLLLISPANAIAVPAQANPARPVSLAVAPLPTSSLPVTTEFTFSVPDLQATTTDAPPSTNGIIISTLETTGNPTNVPFPTPSDVIPTGSIQTPGVKPSSLSTATILPTAETNTNILNAPIATDPPPSLFVTRSDYPQQPVGATIRSGPLQTNKFYANFLLEDQTQPIWPQPYSLTWAKNGNVGRPGLGNSWGLSISNTDRENLIFGDAPEPADPPRYFTAPLYVQSLIVSAVELGADTVLTTDAQGQFSVNVNLLPVANGAPLIRIPVVQGMGFVSALYMEATPLLQSSVFFTALVAAGTVNEGVTYKWQVTLKDETSWLLYITPNGATGRPPLVLQDSTRVVGPAGFSGLIQIAKNTADACGEEVYDSSAGAYATSAAVSASVDGSVGTYSFTWTRGGSDLQKLLMFALPHHIDSMIPDSLNAKTCAVLWTTTKGLTTGITADSWTLRESDLPVDIDFDPWAPFMASVKNISSGAVDQINDAAAHELDEDIDSLTNVDSAYYGGKALSKFAMIIYATYSLGGSSSLAAVGLQKLEQAIARWINNTQIWPFTYDPIWGGIVSTASYDGRDQGLDYGNTFYNDHHFHYGYFVHAAAMIAYLNRDWLHQGANKIWVDTLVRDYANSDVGDPYFPPSRSFDYYNGHSWATGVFPIADGKSEESTSEEAFAAYAMKMWGYVTGDPNMEARGNLQLAIMKNSFANYFYYAASNAVQPASFTPNIVSGILFENKIDHATYFGDKAEYTQGIHMLPIAPITPYLRSSSFIAQEWAAYFQSDIPLYASPDPTTAVIPAIGGYSGGYNCSSRIGLGRLINCVDPEWKGILMGELAQIDPDLSWQFFAAEDGVDGSAGFDYVWVSGSGSRTWYLANAAALGGSTG